MGLRLPNEAEWPAPGETQAGTKLFLRDGKLYTADGEAVDGIKIEAPKVPSGNGLAHSAVKP